MFKSRTLSALITFTLAIAYSGCVSSENSYTTTVLIDTSGSQCRGGCLYLEYIENLLNKLCAGDSVLVKQINDSPFRQSRFIVNEMIEPFRPLSGGNELSYLAGMKKKKQELKEKIAAMLEEPPSNQTCILDSIKLSEDAFRSSATGRHALHVLTDGLEACGNIDFEKSSPNANDVQRILRELKEQGRMPDLGGVVEVHFGLAGGLKGNDNAQRYYALRHFWDEYFKRANARSVRYNFDNFRPDINGCSLKYGF